MINPLKAQLHIFQLEGYSPTRLIKWWLKHPTAFQTGAKKPLLYTFKAKLILTVTFIYYLILVLLFPFPFNFMIIFVLAFEPVPLLLLSLLTIKPYEIIRRQLTILRIRHQIKSHPNLTVVGITGSYGKTTTKDILFEILNRHQMTLKTPESYNTVFGISKVVNFELTSKHHYFICEMGAYHCGEIKELTYMVPPHYGILTAIGTQHLERFKSLKNTTLAKFELVDSLSPENALVNLDNSYIKKHINQPQYKQVKTYSLSDSKADFYLTHYEMNPNGIKFTLKHNGKLHHLATPLFGTSNLSDLVAAISMSLMLHLPIEQIENVVSKLKPSPHRLELKKNGKATLIDNAFSSNQEGFTNIINDLQKLPGNKVLITPGIIELGVQTIPVHKQIGRQAASVFKVVVLVGKSDRTKALEYGLKDSSQNIPTIQYLENSSQLWPEIDKLSQTHDWILLENDLPDNF